MTSRVLIGLDPGFSSVGVAVLRLGETDELVYADVIRTQKVDKKRKILATEDNFRRASEIHQNLMKIVDSYDHGSIVGFCSESMSFPRSSSVAAKIAMCWGVLVGICESKSIPMIQASPQEVKLAVCGSRSASKEAVQGEVRIRFPSIQNLLSKCPASQQQHPYDATAVLIACSKSEVVKMARILK